MDEEELIKLLIQKKLAQGNQDQVVQRSSGSVLGDALVGLLGVKADYQAGGASSKYTQNALATKKAYDTPKLKALKDDGPMKPLMDLYKVKTGQDFKQNQDFDNQDFKVQQLKNQQDFNAQQADLNRQAAEERAKIMAGTQADRQQNTISQQDKTTAQHAVENDLNKIDAAQSKLSEKAFKFSDKNKDQQLTKNALDRMNSARASTSLKGPIGGRIGNMADAIGVASPEYTKFVTEARDTLSNLIKERSGTAASEPEMRRLEQTLPRTIQTDAAFDASLQRAIQVADDIVKQRKQTYIDYALPIVQGAFDDPEMGSHAADAIRQGADPRLILNKAKELKKSKRLK